VKGGRVREDSLRLSAINIPIFSKDLKARDTLYKVAISFA
jgi:hypothetical protein